MDQEFLLKLDSLLLELRLMLENKSKNKKECVNSILIAGKNINGVLGLGKKDIK